MTGVGFTTFKDTTTFSDATTGALLATFVLALLYLTATTVLLFRIHGSVVRSTPDPTDLPPTPPVDGVSTYPRGVAVRVLAYTVANYKANNRVMNELEVAQKCFRNALVVLVAGGIVTVATMLLTAAPSPSGVKLAQALALQGGCSDRPALTLKADGRFAGTCVRAGQPATVTVDANGRVAFPP